MKRKRTSRLHWKLFFPLVGLMWLIIGITIVYFVSHEKHRQRANLENRLLNVNNTVIDAYERGVDLQSTVDFIQLFTDKTTLEPLRITVYDKDGRIVADNPAATINIYDENGRPVAALAELAGSVSGTPVTDVVYEDDISMISSRMSPDGMICSYAGLPYKGEVVDFLSIDPMIWIVVIILGLVTSTLAYFGVHAVCRNVYTLRDFTDKMASDSLPEDLDDQHFSNDELGDVSRNLIALYREKIHAEKEKSYHERQICMNISHELNTPVGIIKGYIDTVLSEPDMPSDVRTQFLTRAQQNATRLASLVADVRMVMRLEANNTLDCSTFDMHALAVRVSQDIVQGHIADGMTFRYEIPDPCLVVGHQSLFTNALLNLIYNAVKYSGGDEIILKWMGEKGGVHTFTFADNGVGVDKAHLGRLFDLFYRVDTGRSRKTGGSGLGLPLVMRIITAMDGTITVTNATPHGLLFTFTLLAPPAP